MSEARVVTQNITKEELKQLAEQRFDVTVNIQKQIIALVKKLVQ